MFPFRLSPASLCRKHLLILLTLLSASAHPSLAAPECWHPDHQAPYIVAPSFPADCRYIFAHMPRLPVLATNPQAADTILSPSIPFYLNTSTYHDSCNIDTTFYSDPKNIPPPDGHSAPDRPASFLDGPPPPPLLTEPQARATWTAMRDGVERILVECGDHGRFGEEKFLALPWGSCYMVVMSSESDERFGRARTWPLQEQLLRGEQIMYRPWMSYDDPFWRTFYSV